MKCNRAVNFVGHFFVFNITFNIRFCYFRSQLQPPASEIFGQDRNGLEPEPVRQRPEKNLVPKFSVQNHQVTRSDYFHPQVRRFDSSENRSQDRSGLSHDHRQDYEPRNLRSHEDEALIFEAQSHEFTKVD